jgi:hypothetical protein
MYIKDVQVVEQDSNNLALSVKFVLNDDTTYICGKESSGSYTSLIDSADPSQENVLVYLSAGLSDNGNGAQGPHAENTLVEITAHYLDLTQFNEPQ